MIPYGPMWRTEWRPVIQLMSEKFLTDDDARAFAAKLARMITVRKAKCDIKVGTLPVAVPFAPDRPESETTPQPGYVPPVPNPPGR